MGNVNGWGGPLPKNWNAQQMKLQKQKLERMRSLGMIPIMSAFSGYVPRAIADRLYPHSNYTRMGAWQGFGGNYSSVLLSATDPLYKVCVFTALLFKNNFRLGSYIQIFIFCS